MKVSKRQLRAIIKEEKSKLLSEQAGVSDALGKLHDAIDALITTMGPDEALIELQGIVDEMSDTRSLSPDSWNRG